MLGPKYWDPNSEVRNVRVPSVGTHHPGTQMKGPRYWDPSKGQRHIMGPARLEALYGSPKVGGTLWVPRLEALNRSPKVRGTLQVPGLEVPFFTPMASTISLKKCKLIAFPANNDICL